jgi:hypothetical protein
LTELGTIPNPFTPASGAPAGVDPQVAPEDPLCVSRRAELEKEIASLLEEYELKVLEQHAATIRSALAPGHPPKKPAHTCGPSLYALAEPPQPKQARSKEPQPSKLHDVNPPFYKAKNQKELDEFIKIIERIFQLNKRYYPTEGVQALYLSQYLRGNPSTCWKHHTPNWDPKSTSWTELNEVL